MLEYDALKVSPHLRPQGRHSPRALSPFPHANITRTITRMPSYYSHTMDSPPSEVSPDTGSSRDPSKGHHKKRVRVWTEDDRAKHRVFEKGRREAFSDSLLVRDETVHCDHLH